MLFILTFKYALDRLDVRCEYLTDIVTESTCTHFGDGKLWTDIWGQGSEEKTQSTSHWHGGYV